MLSSRNVVNTLLQCACLCSIYGLRVLIYRMGIVSGTVWENSSILTKHVAKAMNSNKFDMNFWRNPIYLDKFLKKTDSKHSLRKIFLKFLKNSHI
jgi:hypothetical protein